MYGTATFSWILGKVWGKPDVRDPQTAYARSGLLRGWTATHQVPTFLLDRLEVSLVDAAPDTETFSLQAQLAPTEGQTPSQALGAVERGLNDGLDDVGENADDVVVGLEGERAVQRERVASAGRVREVLRRAGRDERAGRGEVGPEEGLVRCDSAVSSRSTASLGVTHDALARFMLYVRPIK